VLNIPYQIQRYPRWCGPAVLAMILTYYGFNIRQHRIATEVMRGNLSYSNDLGKYAARLGLEAFRIFGLEDANAINKLGELVRNGIPPVVLQRPAPAELDGHFRVVIDVESTAIVVHDPRYGSNLRYSLTNFLQLWKAGGPIEDDNTTLIIRRLRMNSGIDSCPYCGYSPSNTTFTCDYCNQTFPFPQGFPAECSLCNRKWLRIWCGNCNRSWDYFKPEV